VLPETNNSTISPVLRGQKKRSFQSGEAIIGQILEKESFLLALSVAVEQK
jgi:hypothetical protein